MGPRRPRPVRAAQTRTAGGAMLRTSEPYEVDPDFVEALNLLLIVHADHEQNCSTSTVRMG